MSAADHTDEALLLTRLAHGDRAAFEIIYRRYIYDLIQAAGRRLDDPQVAEDLVQDVFLRLWRKRETLTIADLPAYLHTAVRYEVLNHITRRKVPLHFYAPFEAILMETDTPESRLMSKEFLALVLKYAETLSEKRRKVFLLHVQHRLSPREIAEYLNISEKTAYNHLGTAINDLKKRIVPGILLLLLSYL